MALACLKIKKTSWKNSQGKINTFVFEKLLTLKIKFVVKIFSMKDSRDATIILKLLLLDIVCYCLLKCHENCYPQLCLFAVLLESVFWISVLAGYTTA